VGGSLCKKTIIMSKFVRVTDKKFTRVAQMQSPMVGPVQGVSPTDLFTQQQGAPVAQPAVPAMNNPLAVPAAAPAHVQAPAPNPHDMFVKAGIDPRTYVGNAVQNEALRKVLNPSSRNFYDAYVQAFGKWDSHPNDRINNLNGSNQLKAEQAAAKAARDAAAQAAQQQSWQSNYFNPNNPQGYMAPQNPPNYQNLLSPTDPFRGIQNPPFGR